MRYARRGPLIGVVSLYATDFRMPAGMQAVVDAELLRFSPDVVRRAAAEDPRVADALMRELADRAVSYIHEIHDGAFTSVRQRVARHLLDLASQESRAAADHAPSWRSRSASGNSPRPWKCARGGRAGAARLTGDGRDHHPPGPHRDP